jgi:chromosome segregation ATPase
MRPLNKLSGSLGFVVVTVTVFLASASLGQSSCNPPSLGDLARKQRESKQKDAKDAKDAPAKAKGAPAKAKKVVTDEDMPEHAPDSDEAVAGPDGPHDEASVPKSADDVVRTGDQWKAAIAQHKAALADLKNRIDRLNGSIHFVEANAYRNGVEYNKKQEQKQQDVERMQAQYDDQRRDLEQMQENARKAGYGSAVWDP